jgi:serine/threonine protein phosphatase PrpC
VYEPSVEGGQIFTNVQTRSHQADTVGDANTLEANPDMHSINRGTRLQRNALVVVTESEIGAEAATCQFPGKKDQDRYAVQLSPDPAIFPHYVGMFDGHGTSVFAADLCATQMLTEVLGGNTANEDKPIPLPSDESIIRAYRGMHDTVVDMVKQHPRSGTTSVTLFVGRDSADADVDKVKVAWVGDSRCIMLSSEGVVTPLTSDHSLSSNPDEVKRITEADHSPREGLLESPGWAIEEQMAMERGTRARAGSFVGRREIHGREAGPLVVFAHSGGVSLQVSRSIGDALAARSVLPDPEIRTFELPRGARTRFITASDGLWDVYTSEAAGRLIMDVEDPAMAARKLALAARSKRTQTGRTIDDITVIVFDMNPSHNGMTKQISSSGTRHATNDKCTVS